MSSGAERRRASRPAVHVSELRPGHRVAWQRIEGPSNRACLVFLHDGLGCIALWKDFPRLLCEATGHPGLVYDRLGHGRSGPLAGTRSIHYMHDAALAELPALLALAIPGEDHIVVGHSDGGSIGLLHAAQQPPGLRGVITEAAHVIVEPECLVGVDMAVEAYRAGKLRGLAHHGDKADAIFWAWAEIWQRPAFRSWDIRYALPAVTCPVLALQGVDDRFGTEAQTNAIASLCANARSAMVPGCGHALHRDDPEAVLALMREFIVSLDAGASQEPRDDQGGMSPRARR